MRLKTISLYTIHFITIAIALALLVLAVQDTVPYLFPDKREEVAADWILFVTFLFVAVVFGYWWKIYLEQETSKAESGGHKKHDLVPETNGSHRYNPPEINGTDAVIQTANSLGSGFDPPINIKTVRDDEGFASSSPSVSISVAPYKSNLTKVIQDGFDYTYKSKRKPLLTVHDDDEDDE